VGRSTIEGKGLFAITDLPAGEAVPQLGGQLIDDASLATLSLATASVG